MDIIVMTVTGRMTVGDMIRDHMTPLAIQCVHAEWNLSIYSGQNIPLKK